MPELNDSNITNLPILKADCLKFLSEFRMMLPVDSYPNLLSLVCRYLSSSEYVVHTYAASAIERLLCVKDNGVSRLDSKLLAPILEPLLVALFQTLQSEESKENEYVIKAIMRTCSVGQV